MCGRYRLSQWKQIIEEHFDTAPWEADDWSPRYNIASTQPVPVARQHPKEPIRQISLMKWGSIPNWAKDPSIATGTINAKSETAATKPAFRDPLQLRPCLIPADAFYEWKKDGTSKQPFCFEVANGELFAFAGIWGGWKNAAGQWIKTCSILTTTPNAVTSAIHDRMPVILERESYDCSHPYADQLGIWIVVTEKLECSAFTDTQGFAPQERGCRREELRRNPKRRLETRSKGVGRLRSVRVSWLTRSTVRLKASAGPAADQESCSRHQPQ